jgi:Uma2 family endonuclease
MEHVTSYTESQRTTIFGIPSVHTGNVDAMTKLPMSVEEYLRTSFEGPEPEYLDGEIVERNMCELPHASVQGVIYSLLRPFQTTLGVRVFPELRVQVTPTRFRVPDVSVWRGDSEIGPRFPKVPPFLAIEILSAEDRFTRMEIKIREYLAFGVAWLWLLDPDDRKAFVFSPANPGGAEVKDFLRTENPAIEIPLAAVFAELPPRDDPSASS